MQVRYRSDYSNHVHQLVVTVSKHFYVTKQGKFKRQSTPFKAVIGKSSSYTKTHVVHYMITDHYSGLFYSEVTTSDDLFPIEAFLERAWGFKPGHPMQGEPHLLVVPKSVFNAFPGLSAWLYQKPIELVQATSGFPPDFAEVQANSFDSCVFQTRKNFTKWTEGLNI